MTAQPDPMSYEAALTRQSDPNRPKRVRVSGGAQFIAAIGQICTESAAPAFAENDRVDYHGYLCVVAEIHGGTADLRLAGHSHLDFWNVPLAALAPERG